MFDFVELEQMSHVSLETEDIDKLAEIGTVRIDQNLPLPKRLSSYIEQVGNPYCFRSGNIKIKVSYAESGKNLDETVKNFFVGLKNC